MDDFIKYCYQIITFLDEIKFTILHEIDEFLANPEKSGPRTKVAERIIHCIMWGVANLQLNLLVRRAVREDTDSQGEADGTQR